MSGHIYIAGIHSSRKSDLVKSVADKLGWEVTPRQPRTELIDEALIGRLQAEDDSASLILHKRLHRRYRDSIDEWNFHRKLAEGDTSIHRLSDRSPFDVHCYRHALLQLGWLKDAACGQCKDYNARILEAVSTSSGVFLDPLHTVLADEFKTRGMDRLRPLEFLSRYLEISAVEFSRAYSQVIAESARWIRIQHADQKQAVMTVLVIAKCGLRGLSKITN